MWVLKVNEMLTGTTPPQLIRNCSWGSWEAALILSPLEGRDEGLLGLLREWASVRFRTARIAGLRR